VKDCNREYLVGFIDGYMNAIYKHDLKAVPPLAIDVRMTENTGHMEVGEGVLWRIKVEPTPFGIYVADPVTGQVALQARLLIQGRSALVAVRLKVDRGQISEVEQLFDRAINDAALPLLTTPRPGLVTDIPASERASREVAPGARTVPKHIRPRHATIVDQQKGVSTIFCLFVHDGTRRGAKPDDPPGMLMDAMIDDTPRFRDTLGRLTRQTKGRV
jgi:hypothetical protein